MHANVSPTPWVDTVSMLCASMCAGLASLVGGILLLSFGAYRVLNYFSELLQCGSLAGTPLASASARLHAGGVITTPCGSRSDSMPSSQLLKLEALRLHPHL